MAINLKRISEGLNDFSFTVKLPSTGEEIYGKPYTVRDEFTLAQAVESKDKNMMLKKVFELVKSKYYTLTDKQCESMSLVDFESLFIKLKIQSDDKEIPVRILCSKCKKEFKYKLDLTKISVLNGENFKKVISFEHDKLGLVEIGLKALPFLKALELKSPDEKENDIDNVKQILFNIIDYIKCGEEKTDETTPIEDIMNFIEELPKKGYEQIKTFMDNQPELIYNSKVICTNGECKNENTISVEDFFHLFF